jgi:hypothetical protein
MGAVSVVDHTAVPHETLLGRESSTAFNKFSVLSLLTTHHRGDYLWTSREREYCIHLRKEQIERDARASEPHRTSQDYVRASRYFLSLIVMSVYICNLGCGGTCLPVGRSG